MLILSNKNSNKYIYNEIYEIFYTEVDRILASAKIENSLNSYKQSLIKVQKYVQAQKPIKGAKLKISS